MLNVKYLLVNFLITKKCMYFTYLIVLLCFINSGAVQCLKLFKHFYKTTFPMNSFLYLKFITYKSNYYFTRLKLSLPFCFG